MIMIPFAAFFVLSSLLVVPGQCFLARQPLSRKALSSSSSSSSLSAVAPTTSPLPKGISPFEKSASRSIDIQGNFRKLAQPALEQALKDGKMQLEIEFPPLTGGAKSKSQFDDFDNVSELNANRDWCVQLVPSLQNRLTSPTAGKLENTWFILPDDKECELAKVEWTGQRFQSACQFTSIRAACTAVAGGEQIKAWGTSLASAVNKIQGGDGILADSSTLDDLDVSKSRLHLVCQPGNGGPVEDWINVKQLHETTRTSSTSNSLQEQPTCIVNGALDKVRDGYYPGIFFPALAATKSWYDAFEPVFFIKPISDKGLYGWVYRVYPEPWQVVLQTAKSEQKGSTTQVKVEDIVALVSETRPSYQQAVTALIQTASQSS